MIHQPPIDDLAKKVGSKYSLCVVASKRARQIMETAMNQGLNELPNNEKPLSVAAQEINDGKLVATND
ncbi:MAG: DNA-directed RNA polymerase subunit omega [Firmicutes bacterium]|nr:DNA-directed RNA polymerase subunit omega [Candidatus Caballimonas caccae]